MNSEEYLHQLSAELDSLTDEEKAEIIAEVAGHIEEWQSDPKNNTSDDGKQNFLVEMGSPGNLGRGLKEIHRPNLWPDYLLVFLPFEVLKYPIIWLLSLLFASRMASFTPVFSNPFLMTQVRVTIFIYGLLILAALYRRSLPVLFFWLPQLILEIYVLFYREKRWMTDSYFNRNTAGVMESGFWLVLMVGLVCWLAYLILRHRQSSLLVVLALTPFLITIGNMSLNPYLSRGLFPGGYQLPIWHITLLGGFPLGLYQISVILWPVLFFLFRQRPVRWMGLFLYAAPLALANMAASLRYPLLAVVWAVPILLVLFGWMIDLANERLKRHQIA